MAITYIKNGKVILKDRIINGAVIAIKNDKILSIGKIPLSKKDVFAIDAKGAFVSPGFIDCHIHGDPEDIFLNESRYGTTAFLVAESCAPLEHIYRKAEKLKRFIATHPFGKNVLGMRIEGPYISKVKSGAQNISYIRKPDIKELSNIINRCSPILKIMTIAPELNNMHPVIRLLCKNGIVPSIGHSDATYESALAGIDAGISHATHIFNATSGIDRRDPGVAGAVLLDDRVTAEIILDFIHVHKALFNMLTKLKGLKRVIAITDSLAAESSGCVALSNGAYRFVDGRLAGSSLNMIGALKNAVMGLRMPLKKALDIITINPAEFLGLAKYKGSIAPGKDADIVIFDKEFDVKMTMIRGKIAFVKGKICAG